MAVKINVRRAKLADSKAIADFVNLSGRGRGVTRLTIAQRFSDVGFILAEQDDRIVGMLGWQVENLVARVTDFLIAPAFDRVVAGRALIEMMEEQAGQLQVEAIMLFLPSKPSQELVGYWELFGYRRVPFDKLPRQWRAVALEWNPDASNVMIKQLRKDLVRQPI
ncbi:MAG: GNAT family N-acetyltransferase [Anaerolineae bacterium]|nr:GNAT family N-acetyltransferase [Anaerolineae bacterium]